MMKQTRAPAAPAIIGTAVLEYSGCEPQHNHTGIRQNASRGIA
jgi:hypothetical protein